MRIQKLVVTLLLAPVPVMAQVAPELLHHWKYDQTLPVNVKQNAIQEQKGVSIQDVTYESSVGDRGKAVGPNGGKVTAYLVVPEGKGPFPAVIYAHWCMPGSNKKNRNEFLERQSCWRSQESFRCYWTM